MSNEIPLNPISGPLAVIRAAVTEGEPPLWGLTALGAGMAYTSLPRVEGIENMGKFQDWPLDPIFWPLNGVWDLTPL